MEKESLVDLIKSLEQELLRLNYTEGTMQFYRNCWKKLIQFTKEEKEIYFTEKLGIAFAEKCFQISENEFSKVLSQAKTQQLRVIRMLGDFQLHRTILRRYYKHKELITEPYFIEKSTQFNEYCIKKDYSKVTIGHYVKQAERFMDYLVSQKIFTFKDMNLSSINQYIKTLAGYTYKTVEQNICSLRALFRFLLEDEEIDIDFASKMPMIQARKQTRIPSVWTKDELKRLLDAIDRGSPKGKRDYAIILLACNLGLRCTDIKNLKLNNFHWEEKKLIFIQSKTKQMVSLPLTPDVGWAIIDYLKYGRPKTDNEYIFVRHLAPFEEFSQGNHLYQIIKRYMEQAHIPTSKKKRGMHSMRHTMAGMLLEKDTPLPTISEILGHLDTDSTAVYLKIDVEKLKECTLEFEEENCHV